MRAFLISLFLSSSLFGLTIQEAISPQVFQSHPELFIEALEKEEDVEGPGPVSYLLQLLTYQEISNPSKPHSKALDALLARPIQIRAQVPETQESALHIALRYGQNLEVLRKLILRGANIDAVSAEGLSCVTMATVMFRKEILELFIQYGARLDVYTDQLYSLLDLLAETGERGAACRDLLTAQGVASTSGKLLEDLDGAPAFFFARAGRNKALFDQYNADDLLLLMDADGRSIYHHAALGNNSALFTALPPAPIDLSCRDNRGQTPADLAKTLKLPQPALKLKGNYTPHARASEFFFEDPLWNAALYGDEATLRDLISKLPDSLQKVEKNGYCLLSYATYLKPSIIRILLSAQAKLPPASHLLTLAPQSLAHQTTDLFLQAQAAKIALLQAAGLKFTKADYAAYKISLEDYNLIAKTRTDFERPLPALESLYLPDEAIQCLCQLGKWKDPREAIKAAADGDLKRLQEVYNRTHSAFLYPGPDGLHTSALIAALSQGHLAAARYLLEEGCYAEQIDEKQQTALSCAIDLQDEDLVRIILSSMDVSAIVAGRSNNLGRVLHPYIQAALFRNIPLLKLLDARRLDFAPARAYLSELVVSTAAEDANFLSYLVQQGAPVNTQNEKGQTPLLAAIQTRNLESVNLLLELPQTLINLPDFSGTTPLMCAALQDQASLISQLVARGADVNLVNHQAETSLDLALSKKNIQAALALVLAGSPLSKKNAGGLTPLAVAVNMGSLELVQQMLARGAWIDAPAPSGKTALHLAVVQGHEDIALALVAMGANPLLTDQEGKSALSHATLLGQTKVRDAIYAKTVPSPIARIESIMELAIGFVLLIAASLLFLTSKDSHFVIPMRKWGRILGKSRALTALTSFCLSALSSSSASVQTVTTWLFEDGLLPLGSYLLALTFAELGACSLFLYIGISKAWFIGLSLGLFGMLYFKNKPEWLRPYLAPVATFGLTLLGIQLIETTLAVMASRPLIVSGVELVNTSMLASILVGFVGTLLLQSLIGAQVALLVLASLTPLRLEALIAALAGTYLASSFYSLFPFKPFDQLSLFAAKLQTRLQLITGSILVLVVAIESAFGIPLIVHGARALLPESSSQFLGVIVLVAAARALAVAALLPYLVSWCKRYLPEENLIAVPYPEHIDPFESQSAAVVLDLVEQEQESLLRRIEKYPAVYKNKGAMKEHHNAFKKVHRLLVGICTKVEVSEPRIADILAKQRFLDLYERYIFGYGSYIATVSDQALANTLDRIYPLLAKIGENKEALATELQLLNQNPNPEAVEPASYIKEVLRLVGKQH